MKLVVVESDLRFVLFRERVHNILCVAGGTALGGSGSAEECCRKSKNWL